MGRGQSSSCSVFNVNITRSVFMSLGLLLFAGCVGYHDLDHGLIRKGLPQLTCQTPHPGLFNNTPSPRGRIAIISIHGDPDSQSLGHQFTGGQNVYVRAIGEGLSKLGWTVDMFTRRISPAQAPQSIHFENCRTIRLQAGPLAPLHRDDLYQLTPNFLESFLRFQRAHDLTYDLIHTNYWISGSVGLQLRKILRVPLVHTYHSVGAVKFRAQEGLTSTPTSSNLTQQLGGKSKVRLEIEEEILGTASTVVSTSPGEENDLRAFMGLAAGSGRIRVIPCGTNVARFSRMTKAEARGHLGIPLDHKVVLYVGRFDERKGIEILIRAISQSKYRHSKKFHLVLAGGGGLVGAAAAQAANSGDSKEILRVMGLVTSLDLSNVTNFPGALGGTSLEAHFAGADVTVVPSLYEPFGLVAIEAMASRTPVIASDVGGLRHTVIHGETGLLVRVKDVDGFRSGIEWILKNPGRAKRMGQNGLSRVRDHFTWDFVARNLSQLYSELIGPRYCGVMGGRK